MALYVICWLTITLLLALAGYAIDAKLRDQPAINLTHRNYYQ